MGNGSGAGLARRVDGAQLECASAARGLGAARVSLSANARAAAAALYKRPGAAVGGTAGGVAGGAAVGRRDGVQARAQYSWRCWLLRRSRARKPLWRCGNGRECVDVSLSRKMRCERAKMAFFLWLAPRPALAGNSLMGGDEARAKTRW